MGFGSYDESEQQDQQVNTEDDGVTVHENDHNGEVTYDADASTDELLDQLQDIQNDE